MDPEIEAYFSELRYGFVGLVVSFLMTRPLTSTWDSFAPLDLSAYIFPCNFKSLALSLTSSYASISEFMPLTSGIRIIDRVAVYLSWIVSKL